MSIEWTSPDVTIPSQSISSLDDTPTSVGSTTLEVSNFLWYMQVRFNSIICYRAKQCIGVHIYTTTHKYKTVNVDKIRHYYNGTSNKIMA